MILSSQQIEYIDNNLKNYGVQSDALREDLLDHICTYIETNESQDFEQLYKEALQKFGGYANFQNLQLETNWQKFNKELATLNSIKFIVGCIASMLLVISLLFKMMHWPFANVMMVSAIFILALVALPIHFYTKYKSTTHKFS